MLTDDSHRLLNAKLEQKEFAKTYLSSTYVDTTAVEHAKTHRRSIIKKLEELQRRENVQRIRVTVSNQFNRLFVCFLLMLSCISEVVMYICSVVEY